MSSAIDLAMEDFEGMQPAADEISKKVMLEICQKTVPDYKGFIQARLVSDSVEKARAMAISAGVLAGKVDSRPFFVSDEEMGINGTIGNSFALVKPGKKDSPLRIIISHSDVPCLKVPVNPNYVERDSEKSLACPSISLYTEPFGGVRPDDWYGMEVDLIGKVFIEGEEKRISLPGRIKQKSVHVDDSRIIKTLEGLKVDTGFRTFEQLYSALGIRNSDDFARAKLYCLPHFIEGNNGRLIGNELGAFGHDDRSCVWASVKAGLESLVDNDNNLMIFGLDNEEVGSIGNSASYKGFFESVLKETLKIVYGDKAKDFDLPLDLNRKLLGQMPAIFADVDVGLGPEELDDPFNVNFRGATKLGWGVVINSSGVTTSPKHVDRFISLLQKNFSGRERDYRYQIGGSYTPVDSCYSAAHMSDMFEGNIPCLNVGIPVTGLHHPRAETINVFDLHFLKEAYKIYLKN